MDQLLKIFFEPDRWSKAIDIGVDKGINKKELRDLCTVEKRIALLQAIENGKYEITPPHQAEIPKDDGTMRIVYVNEGIDRIVLSIVNDMLFEMMSERVHPACKSYQKGVGCGKVVQKVSEMIADANGEIIGWKSDLSKYFDSVPIESIDAEFDRVEEKFGKSKIIDIVRKYYHSDYCFDTEGKLIKHYQSLKQGCAVASWLADVCLYHIDEKLSNLNGFYVRYSDDTLFVGKDYEKAMQIMRDELSKMNMKLNPKKVQYLSSKNWFTFLGYSIKGDKISLSKKRLKTFQKEIERRTIKEKKITLRKAVNKVNNYLYKGNGKHAWAEQVLAIINSSDDIKLMNEFIMDCLRACVTGKKRVGGLGYENHENGTVTRGIGSNTRSNRLKTADNILGYKSLSCMRTALLCGSNVFRAMVLNLGCDINIKYTENYDEMTQEECLQKIDEYYEVYKYSLPSEYSENNRTLFYAEPVDNLTTEQMCMGMDRIAAKRQLESFIVSNIKNGNLKWDPLWGTWHHCCTDRDMVLFKEWFELIYERRECG